MLTYNKTRIKERKTPAQLVVDEAAQTTSAIRQWRLQHFEASAKLTFCRNHAIDLFVVE